MEGSLKPQKGEVWHFPELQMAYVSQNRDDLQAEDTPWNYVGGGLDMVFFGGRQMHVATYLKQFLFESEELKRPLKSFSGGEKARLQLAKGLLQPADVFFIDEPTNDLDIPTIERLEKMLADFKGSLFVISHDRAFLSNVTNSTFLNEENDWKFFGAGFDQVATYLEQRKLEKELQKEGDLTEEKVPKKGPIKKRKLSFQEQQLLKSLPGKVEELELSLESLQSQVDNFDFESGDHQKFQSLTQELEAIESDYLKALETLEDLESV